MLLQVSVVPEGSELLPGGYTVLMRLPRSYTYAAQSDFLVDVLVTSHFTLLCFRVVHCQDATQASHSMSGRCTWQITTYFTAANNG
jgi:hypothetical protein